MKIDRLLLALTLAHAPVVRAEDAPPSPRYSTIAACETVLLNLRRQVPEVTDGGRPGVVDFNARRVMPALERIASLSGSLENHTTDRTDDHGEQAHAQANELNQIIQSIAERPNYRTEEAFAVTDVYVGTDAIEAYLKSSEEQAVRLEGEAFRRVEARMFTRQTARRHAAAVLGLVGGLGTVWAAAVVVPLIIQAHAPMSPLAFAALSGGLSFFGSIGAMIVAAPRAGWAARILRAHHDPRRRRPLINSIWDVDESEYFDGLKAMIKMKAVAEMLRERSSEFAEFSAQTHSVLNYHVPRGHLGRLLDTPASSLESATVDFLASRRDSKTPAWVMPPSPVSPGSDPRRAELRLINVLFLDPETKDVSLIVHARGEFKNAPTIAH